MPVLVALAWMWSLPVTLIGLAFCLVCRPQAAWWHDGCLEMRVAWLPMRATGETWGRLILYRTDTPDAIRAHERVHVAQASILGPLFILAYPGASLVAMLGGGNFYWDNAFERQARARSGQ